MSVAAAQDWDGVFVLDRYCMVELQFWKGNLRSVYSKTVSDLAFPLICIYSDASNVACAGHIAGNDVHAHRMFTEAERQESSTYRELLAVQFVLSSFSWFLPNCRVKWFTDSQGAARIVQVGSMNFNLQKLAFDIFSLCFKVGIYLDIQWVPRIDHLMKKPISSARLWIMTIGSLPPGSVGNWTSFGVYLRLIALPPTTTRSRNVSLDSGILRQPGLTRFSKTGNTKIA